MKKILLFALMAMTPFVLKADEKTTKILDRAYTYMLDKKYKDAISTTEPLINNLSLNRIEDIILAHQMLALAYCEIGKKDLSLEHLKALRAFSPNENFREFRPSLTCAGMLAPPSQFEDKSKKSK